MGSFEYIVSDAWVVSGNKAGNINLTCLRLLHDFQMCPKSKSFALLKT